MGWESFGVVGFDLGLLLQGQMRRAKPKSAYNSLIIGPRGLQFETNQQEIMECESSDVVRFLTLGPSFKVKQGQPSLIVLITRLLLVLEIWDGKPTYRKSWAGNLLVW